MGRFLKYQFESKEAWEAIKESVSTSTVLPEGETASHIEGAVASEVGYVMITPPVVDENDPFNEITPAIFETAYSVDILWETEEAEGFEAYRIYPNPETMKHTFYGMDDLYKEEYNNRPQ